MLRGLTSIPQPSPRTPFLCELNSLNICMCLSTIRSSFFPFESPLSNYSSSDKLELALCELPTPLTLALEDCLLVSTFVILSMICESLSKGDPFDMFFYLGDTLPFVVSVSFAEMSTELLTLYTPQRFHSVCCSPYIPLSKEIIFYVLRTGKMYILQIQS